MKKIIRRNITNEDGDVYGVIGDLTRLGAYRAIRQDLREYGVEDEVKFGIDELEECEFWETTDKGEYEGWAWWKKPKAGLNPKPLGKGWLYII